MFAVYLISNCSDFQLVTQVEADTQVALLCIKIPVHILVSGITDVFYMFFWFLICSLGNTKQNSWCY